MQSKIRLTAADKMEKAYFEMLETTHYTKISVSDIIEKAGVSRTTFYRHYDDIFDMYEKTADKLSRGIIDECLNIMFVKSGDTYSQIADVFITQDKYITLISGRNGSRGFFDAMYRNTMQCFTPAFSSITQEKVFRFKFVIIAVIGIYVRKILENEVDKREEYDTQIIDICKRVINLEKFAEETYGK